MLRKNLTTTKNKQQPRLDRSAQLTQVEAVIEQKKRELQKRFRKETESLVRSAGSQHSPVINEESNPCCKSKTIFSIQAKTLKQSTNIFSNDGSFLDQFLKASTTKRVPGMKINIRSSLSSFKNLFKVDKTQNTTSTTNPTSVDKEGQNHKSPSTATALQLSSSSPPLTITSSLKNIPEPKTLDSKTILSPGPINALLIPPPAPLNAHTIPPPLPLNALTIPPPAPLNAFQIPPPEPLNILKIPPPEPLKASNIPAPAPLMLQNIPAPSPLRLDDIPQPEGINLSWNLPNMHVPPPNMQVSENGIQSLLATTVARPFQFEDPGTNRSHSAPVPLMSIPTKELIPHNVNKSSLSVLPVGSASQHAMVNIARKVAQFGQSFEEMARQRNHHDPTMWFLYNPQSAAYKDYRFMVDKFKSELGVNSNNSKESTQKYYDNRLKSNESNNRESHDRYSRYRSSDYKQERFDDDFEYNKNVDYKYKNHENGTKFSKIRNDDDRNLKKQLTEDPEDRFDHQRQSNKYKTCNGNFEAIQTKIPISPAYNFQVQSTSEQKYDPEEALENKYDPEEAFNDIKTDLKCEPENNIVKNQIWPVIQTELKWEVKTEYPNSDGEEKKEQPVERKRKRKSRWGTKTDTPTDANATISGFTGVITSIPNVLAVTGNIPPMLSKVTRQDPALQLYAKNAFGTLDLSEEEWKKAEDHYKINLLYQDIQRKRNEIERLQQAGKFKYEYDSDEDTDGGTWEHKLRIQEMEATKIWAEEVTKKAEGKHHIGDFLPPEELRKFLEKSTAAKEGREPDLSDYKEYKLSSENKGFKMLQKLGWSEGQGLGVNNTGIVEPLNKAAQRDTNQGLGVLESSGMENDDEYDSYRKRMMIAYRFRPNPLVTYLQKCRVGHCRHCVGGVKSTVTLM